jgi:hypothetical protein
MVDQSMERASAEPGRDLTNPSGHGPAVSGLEASGPLTTSSVRKRTPHLVSWTPKRSAVPRRLGGDDQ